MSSTPCSASRGPPTAVSSSSGCIRLSAPATPAACRSPDASPATKRTLRMVVRVSDQRRQSQLDLLHDPERDTQRQSPFFAGYYHWRFAGQRRDKTLLLQLQRFAIGRVQFLSLDV